MDKHTTASQNPKGPGMVLALALLFATGCGSGNYTRSVYGTVGGYSLANANPTPPSLLVTRKVERPLFIILDASRVRDSWNLETSGCATDSSDCERFDLMDFQVFVRRDLKTAMENYFSRVEVVGSPQQLPTTPHVVADVKVDAVRLNQLVRGLAVHTLIEMNWGFALRLSEREEYSYSFAGTAVSNDSYPTFEAGCATLVENAIVGMLDEWVEDDGIQALREADANGSSAQPHPTSEAAGDEI